MINAEKFKKEINNNNNEFGLTDSIVDCKTLDCKNCRFSCLNNSDDEIILCSTRKVKWLLSEYKEPPVKVSKLEYDILKYLSDNTAYLYIARDSTSNLFAYRLGPTKGTHGWNGRGYTPVTVFNKLFLFIKWENEESTSIKDVLENCVVKEIEEEQ